MISNRHRRALSIVELLICLGIVVLLIGILLPVLSSVRSRANLVACQSNLRQLGQALQIYVNENNSWMYPSGGSAQDRDQRWPILVLQDGVWNPPVVVCPADSHPAEDLSYIINGHLAERRVKWTSDPSGLSSSRIIVVGEKKSESSDYYMETGEDFNATVELYRHGRKVGSNYLFMDWHVEPMVGTPQRLTGRVLLGIDPWDSWDIPKRDH